MKHYTRGIYYKYIIVLLLIIYSSISYGAVNEHIFIVKNNDTLTKYFKQLNISQNILWAILNKDSNSKELNNLQLGSKVIIKNNHNNKYLQIIYKISKATTLIYTYNNSKISNDSIINYQTKALAIKTITIKKSLFYDGRKTGVSKKVLELIYSKLRNLIDFYHDIKKGDKFIIVYKKYPINSKPEAIYYLGANKVIKIYLYKNKYYHSNSYKFNSLFIKPVNNSIVSSEFSKRRYHPILKKYLGHKGIDYAAKTGTPIYASRDGSVKFIKSIASYGNVIYINHDKKYTTVYAHLSKFAKNIKEGKKVSQGNLIGFVGQTGWSTGPHLHFEIRVYNEAQNPKSLIGKSIKSQNYDDYLAFKSKVSAINLFTKINKK